jgi:Catalase
MAQPTSYVHYSDSVEVRQPDEEELIDKIVASMARVNRRVFDSHRHATRDAHAKSHGIVKGTLSVYPDLAEPLQQGVFRRPRSYPIVIRFSSAPGDIRDDSIPVPRGMAIKLIGVEGTQVLPDRGSAVTQDFLLVNLPILPFGHVAAYWDTQQVLEKHADDPDFVKRLTAEAAHRLSKILSMVGIENRKLEGLGPPNTHILGETFYSMAALRFGDYIAKVSAAPLSDSVRRLSGQLIDPRGNPSVLRDLVVEFFSRNTAEYELRVQLCTDLERMPVEDASIEWPEDESPYLPIAKITLPGQEAYSPARRVYGDDILSFNPWHCIEEHRPLGSIMRARIKAYEESIRFRHEMNAQPRLEPQDLSDIPD